MRYSLAFIAIPAAVWAAPIKPTSLILPRVPEGVDVDLGGLQLKRAPEGVDVDLGGIQLKRAPEGVDVDLGGLQLKRAPGTENDPIDLTDSLGPVGGVVDGVNSVVGSVADVNVDAPILPREPEGVDVDLGGLQLKREPAQADALVEPKIIYD